MIPTVELRKNDVISLKNCVVMREEDYLKTYTREELDKYINSAKEAGRREASCDDGKINRARDDGYMQGINEVWECFQDIVQMGYDDGKKMFGSSNYSDIVFNYSASEVMQMMKEYKEKKSKENTGDFKVGEVVVAPGYLHPVVVIVVDDTQIRVMNHLGDNSWVSKCKVKKTGDYLKQVGQLFNLIKGVADK